MKLREKLAGSLLIAGFTALGFAVMGYHPGLEDDGIYLAAVKANLIPPSSPSIPGFFDCRCRPQSSTAGWHSLSG